MTVDSVSVKVASGYNMISLGDWVGKPLEERIEIIKAGNVEFLSGGNPVPLKEALAWIKNNKDAAK